MKIKDMLGMPLFDVSHYQGGIDWAAKALDKTVFALHDLSSETWHVVRDMQDVNDFMKSYRKKWMYLKRYERRGERMCRRLNGKKR